MVGRRRRERYMHTLTSPEPSTASISLLAIAGKHSHDRVYPHTALYRERETSSHQVHLEVDQLPSSEGDDHLMVVEGTLRYGSFARGLPLVDSLVRTDVSDTLRVYLTETERVRCTVSFNFNLQICSSVSESKPVSQHTSDWGGIHRSSQTAAQFTTNHLPPPTTP